MPDATTPLIDRPTDMLKEIRDPMRREVAPEFHQYVTEGRYPEYKGKRSKVEIPKTLKDMYEALDEKVEKELGPEAQKKEEDEKKYVPQMVLRDLDEKGWENLEWPEAKRTEVVRLLRGRLKIGENQAQRAMHILVSEGKKPDDIIAILQDDSQYNYYSTIDDGKTAVEGRMREESYQRLDGANESRAHKLLYLQEKLGITNDVYIMRFILEDEYVLALNHMYRDEYVGYRDQKGGLYDLAWNIGFSEKEEFGMDGLYPVLQMQVSKNKETDETEGRYVVNQANFIRWMRNKMYTRWEEMDTDEVTNYFGELKVDKGQFTSVSLAHMILESSFYFKDETGHTWNALYNQVLLEPWMLMTTRQYYESYRKAMGSEEDLMKTYNSEYYLSKLTRKIYGKSMLNILMTLPEDFKRRDADTKLGEAWLKMYLAYYNLADFTELEKVLGKDSSFFTKEGWMEAIKDVYKDELTSSIGGAAVPRLGRFFGDKEEFFAKAFAKDNTITDKDAFIKFVNFYPDATAGSTVMEIVNQAIRNAVKKMLVSKEVNPNSEKAGEHGSEPLLDDISLKYGWLIARTMTLPTGVAAKNNWPGVSGHLAETKWLHTRMYRDKYIGYGGGGNPYTVHMFKKLGLPLLESILLDTDYAEYISTYNSDGTPVYKKRKLTPMEVIRQMNEVSQKWEKQRVKLEDALREATSESERKRIQLQLDMVDDYAKNAYKESASRLVFVDDAMKNWAQNIVGRAKVVYDTVMGGNEINFEDFIKYDGVFRGVSFERDKWQKAIQGGLITPLRYLIEANGASQFNMVVRDTVYAGKDDKGKSKWEMKEMYLGEAVFGHQILDIPEFRKTRQDVSSEEWEDLKSKGFTLNGKEIVRPDGLNLIDYNKVQENKTLAYKQWILMKFAGDLWTHIDMHSTDPAFGMEHYMNVLDAIAQLPGSLLGDQTNVKNAKIVDTFFSKEQMKWLKQISGTTTGRMFMRHFFMDIVTGDKKKPQPKFGESFSIIIARIFKGY